LMSVQRRRSRTFNYEEELKAFLDALRAGIPMVLILAPRRYGKTSLLRVGLYESKLPSIFMDCRVLEAEGLAGHP